MSVTKEQVLEEAKKLKLQLSEEQVGAYVLIGALPKAADTGSTTGDDNDDDDADDKDSGDKDGAQKRIKQLAEQKRALKKEKEDLAKKLKELEDAKADAARKTDEGKGNYEKLTAETAAAKKKAEDAIVTIKERMKKGAVESAAKEALRDAGVPVARLAKAIKLFDLQSIEFDWTNEEALEYEISDFKPTVDAFKKENDFLFNSDEQDETPSGIQGRSQPTKGGKSEREKEKLERLRNQFSALR